FYHVNFDCTTKEPRRTLLLIFVSVWPFRGFAQFFCSPSPCST
ncbi:unnamed protein product, partial [Amoebophrya sp. A25]